MEGNDPPAVVPLVSLSEIEASNAQTTFFSTNNNNHNNARIREHSPIPIITTSDSEIRRRTRSISPTHDLNKNDERKLNLNRSYTLGHTYSLPINTRPSLTTSKTFIDSSDQLLRNVDMLAYESWTTSQQPTRMPSFLNMRRNNTDDVVELSDVPRRESFTSESDFRHRGEDDEGFDHIDNIDDSETAKLTKNRVDQPLDSFKNVNPSYGNNGNNRVNALRHTNSLSRMSQVLARASTRVVNMANASPEQLEKEELDSNAQPKPTIRKSWKNNLCFTNKNGPTSNDNLNSSRQSNSRDPQINSNLQSQPPLEGRSLYIFGPENPIRLALYEALNNPYTESIILVLILANILLLIIDAWDPVTDNNPRRVKWGSSGIDYALLVIFILYTLEIIARIIVSGLVINAKPSLKKAKYSPPTSPNVSKHNERELSVDSQYLQSSNQYVSRVIAHKSAMNTAFLRHSFNRIDLLAVMSYWIDLLITLVGVQDFYLFKAISTLRSLRLLSITSGCATILQSLKKSAPLLANVMSFIGFFFVLLSIIGVQSFQGSLSRRCMWTEGDKSYWLDKQYCGGWVDKDGITRGWMDTDGTVNKQSKGFICSMGQVCRAGGNTFDGFKSFDNVFSSMILVFVTSTVQTWTDIMYNVMDSEYYVACIYFILAVIILNFWLINLFVAVITTMFAKIREDTSHSAFTLSKSTPILSDDTEGWTLQDGKQVIKTSWLTRIMDETKYVWVLLIFADVFIMAFRTANMPPGKQFFLDTTESIFTVVFAIEITLRFFSYFPKYLLFFRSTKNVVDLTLAIVTLTIQLPFIKSSDAYRYLTLFQVLRFYRVIIAIPRLRNLLVRVLGSVAGFANLVLFIFIVNFVAAIIGVQLLRGTIPEKDDDDSEIEMRFGDIFNSFIALYQVFSGENWTDILYNVMQYERKSTAIIAIIFLIIYVALSNFILLTMFIAALKENFEIAEEQKHKIQLQTFKRNIDPTEKKDDIIYRWNFYKYFQAKPKTLAVESIPNNLILHTQKCRVREFLTDNNNSSFVEKKRKRSSANFLTCLKRYFGYDDEMDKIPLLGSRRGSNFDNAQGTTGTNDLGEPITDKPTEAFIDDFQEHQAVKADFLAAHPNYDASLWCLSPRNRFRRFCQLLVKPSHGDRMYGTPPSPILSFSFSVFIYLCIISSVTLAATSNLPYQKRYYEQHEIESYPWFWIMDVVFVGIFTIEFIIKIIADGFLLTPNAYLLNVWNQLDFFVLVTLYINALIPPTSNGSFEKIIHSFKALRALRLITFSSSTKDTFYSILIAGAPRIIDAAILSISLVIPFAIYGVNIFAGLFFACNDDSDFITEKYQCVGEFQNKVYNFPVLTPRKWSNPPGYHFDDFRSAFLILFELISGEGWIDVMVTSMQIVGPDKQPKHDASKWNALFFMVFNMAGSVFILTLFISVIISNYQLKSGTSYLTADQKRWVDLKKILKQITPSKIPKKRPSNWFRGLCFDYATEKRGKLTKIMNIIYILHILLLMTEVRESPNSFDWNHNKGYIFAVLIVIYIIEFSIKAIGLGRKVFQNKWNLFDLLVITGSAATTISALAARENLSVGQAQKYFLVLICLKLFQKSDVMNQLFKNMIGSLPSILNLLAVWSVIFVVYAIMFMEIFGLTRYGTNENKHVNFREFQGAILTLIRMSTGEGWNSIMHDFTVEPPNCIESDNLFQSDCGSTAWAYLLFISWNVLSMYIFANMFTLVVSDNFSYCYQIAAEFSLVNRDEIRKFKKAWRTVDFDRTGYIKSDEIAKFFSKLEGLFQVRIYQDRFLVPNLIDNSRVTPAEPGQLWGSTRQKNNLLEVGDLDVRKLERNLSNIDINQVYERRKTYNKLYQEALLLIEKDSNGNEKGISFTSMLIMLARYKLISDDKCLEIREYIKRKEQLEKVIDNVNRDGVKSLLRTIYWRKKFKMIREKRLNSERMSETAASIDVPRIMVNDSILSQSSQTRNIRTPSPVPSFTSTQTQFQTPTSSEPPGSPGSSHSFNSDPYVSNNLDYFSSRASVRRASGESSTGVASDIVYNEGENLLEGSWNSINTNTEMDDQTANQLLNSLQSNYWHDVLQEMSKNDSNQNYI